MTINSRLKDLANTFGISVGTLAILDILGSIRRHPVWTLSHRIIGCVSFSVLITIIWMSLYHLYRWTFGFPKKSNK